jgi:uncharacterized protein (TIGR03437 family)
VIPRTGFGAVSPGLSVVSGNGQVTLQFFNTSAPLTVQARDANGNPLPNLPLTWAVTQGYGTVVSAPDRTDSKGMASAFFRGDVLPGYSFSQQTVTVSSAAGSASFVITTVINRLPSGSLAELPLVELLSPPPDNRNLTGRSGSTLPGAIRLSVVVQSGPQSGLPIPNVGMRIVDAQDPSATPVAQCAGQPMTNDSGIAQCDLLITGAPGLYLIAAEVGEFRITPGIFLKIESGAACTYTVAASSQQFAAAAGLGSISVTAPSGCTWTAASNSTWITISSGTSGSGSGGLTFSVAANTGAARTGSISVAGQSLTINQAGTTGGGGSGTLTIATNSSLPSAVVGSAYTTTLVASGGVPPYSWIATASLPAGLTLNPTTGAISGTPTTAGTYSLPITVSDHSGQTRSQTFSLTVVPSGGGGGQPGPNPAITNTAFPNGVVGASYQQVLFSSGGCISPVSPPPTYAVAGGALPAGLILQALTDRTYAIAGTPSTAGTFNFSLQVTDSCGKAGVSNYSITISGTGGGGGGQTGPLTANPATLSFSLANGNAGTLQELPLTISGPAGATYTAFAVVTSGGNWLSIVGQNSGALPATLTVRAAGTGGLAGGVYTGSISITSSSGQISVPVTLTVAGGSAVLSVTPDAVNYTVEAGSAAIQQVVTITNARGVAHFTVQASTVNGGNWLTASASSGDTPATITVTLNPAGLQPSIYMGNVVITPTSPIGPAKVIPVNLKVLLPPAAAIAPGTLKFISNDASVLPAPQTLSVTSTGMPFDSTVKATTTSGGDWLIVTPDKGSTPLQVQVQANPAGLDAGTYEGHIIVSSSTPGVSGVSVPVTLIVTQSRPFVLSITNAASFQPGAIAPGEIITIFGSGLGPSELVTSKLTESGRLDSNLEQSRVYFDGVAAPLVYTKANQLSAVVPYSVAGQETTTVEVEYKGVRSTAVPMRVARSAPAIFTLSPSGQAAALNEDGSVNSVDNGAEPGSVVALYATGEGQTDPPGVDGKLALDVYPKPVLPVSVRVNGEYANVLYAGAAPGLVAGAMQVNIQLPADLPRGVAVPVVLVVGEVASPAGVTIATKP